MTAVKMPEYDRVRLCAGRTIFVKGEGAVQQTITAQLKHATQSDRDKQPDA
jgi:hypothetical protein